MHLKSILNILLIIAAVYALMHRSLFDNASKRTKYRFLSRAEGRGENVKGRGFKICQGFIYLIVYYYLYFLERARFIICRHQRRDHAKQNLVIYGGSFNDQETSLVTGFDR